MWNVCVYFILFPHSSLYFVYPQATQKTRSLNIFVFPRLRYNLQNHERQQNRTRAEEPHVQAVTDLAKSMDFVFDLEHYGVSPDHTPARTFI